ncbi:MAG: ComEC/Rec2 family competence protein [Minisyncoccota bacterium]
MARTLPISAYVFLFLGLLAANYTIYKSVLAPPTLTVSIVEAGKGNAVLVRATDGATLLIDTGSDASILRVLGGTLPMWQRSLPAIILTSDAAKNAGGLPDVLARYHATQVIRVNGRDAPYGTLLTFDTTIGITIIAPGAFDISYGPASLSISSSTLAGTYISEGETFRKK